MNATANLLELQKTHFENPHGLHHRQHKSTARDMAVLAVEAMQDATFREIVAATAVERRIYNTHDRRYRVMRG